MENHCRPKTVGFCHRLSPSGHRPPLTIHLPLPTPNHPPPTNHYPPATSHRPPPTGHRPLPIAHLPLPTAHQPLAKSHCPPPTAHAHLPLAYDYHLGDNVLGAEATIEAHSFQNLSVFNTQYFKISLRQRLFQKLTILDKNICKYATFSSAVFCAKVLIFSIFLQFGSFKS